jgi:Rrf2 family protein
VRLELTKRGDYAVRAMLALAGDGDGLLSARRIAAEMAIPPRFLPQVMGDLVRAGLVEGVPGRSGGYRLSHPAAEISLLTIVEAIEGDSRRTSCVLRGGPCRGEGACAVHTTFIAAEEGMIAALAGMTLAEVAGADVGRAEHSPADGAGAAS